MPADGLAREPALVRDRTTKSVWLKIIRSGQNDRVFAGDILICCVFKLFRFHPMKFVPNNSYGVGSVMVLCLTNYLNHSMCFNMFCFREKFHSRVPIKFDPVNNMFILLSELVMPAQMLIVRFWPSIVYPVVVVVTSLMLLLQRYDVIHSEQLKINELTQGRWDNEGESGYVTHIVDIMKSKRFPHYWPFLTRNHWSPVVSHACKGPVMLCCDNPFSVSMNKLLNNYSIWQRFETSWHPCHF